MPQCTAELRPVLWHPVRGHSTSSYQFQHVQPMPEWSWDPHREPAFASRMYAGNSEVLRHVHPQWLQDRSIIKCSYFIRNLSKKLHFAVAEVKIFLSQVNFAPYETKTAVL